MIEDQPPPIPSDRVAIVDLVVADMVERKRVGIERYGTPLQPFNGRDALVDAYQEALDLVMYLRQAIEERSRPNTDLRRRVKEMIEESKNPRELANVVRYLLEEIEGRDAAARV